MIIYYFSQFSESEVRGGLRWVFLLLHVVLAPSLGCIQLATVLSWEVQAGFTQAGHLSASFLWCFIVGGPARAAV